MFPINRITATTSSEGFSLAEMLIAMALLSMTVALIVYAISGAGQALHHFEYDRAAQALPAVRQFLNHALEQARPVQRPGRSAKNSLMIDGSRDAIEFISGYAPAGHYQGLHVTRISLRSRDDGKQDLLVAQELYRRDTSGNVAVARQMPSRTLLEGIETISLRYLDPAAVPQMRWLDTWQSSNRLPAAIALDVHFPTGDKRKWPTLVAELMLAE